MTTQHLFQPTDDFSHRHLGPTRADIQEMLAALGLLSLDALADAAVPSDLRFRRSLDGPAGDRAARSTGCASSKTSATATGSYRGEADYNIADILFKDGKAAMIINGDWSWAGYQKAGIRIGVAPLPRIEETGLWCAPMVSPKGFSMNVNVRPEKRPLVIRLLKFLMRPDVQLQTARSLLTMPTRREALADDFVRNDPIMKNSAQQIRQGRTMPVFPELRAIWDAMRPRYQAVLGGAKSPEQAAREMQDLAVRKIKEMNE